MFLSEYLEKKIPYKFILTFFYYDVQNKKLCKNNSTVNLKFEKSPGKNHGKCFAVDFSIGKKFVLFVNFFGKDEISFITEKFNGVRKWK